MLPKNNAIIGIAFAIPVLCSLIGAGAFVLLVTPVPEEGLPGPDPNEVDAVQQKVDELRAELERTNKLLAEFKEEQKRVVLEQKVKELLDELESSTAELLREVSGLGEEVVIIENVIQDLDSSDGERQKQRDFQQATGRLQAYAPESHLNRPAHTGMHSPDRDERG